MFRKIRSTIKYLFKRYILLIKDVPTVREDSILMSVRAAALFSKKKYLEQNLKTSLKPILELLQTEMFYSTYFGIPATKSPFDFWIYRELIYEIKPDVIVEIGNYCGGSTLALTHILDNIGRGRIIGIDVKHDTIAEVVRKHPRISLITGDACMSFPTVKNMIREGEKVLIIEDSSHTYENTLQVLRTFNPLVTKGSYFIVEDSICHHGVDIGPRPGPYEAIETFIKENKNFQIDRTRERFLITWNPKGYLKRIR